MNRIGAALLALALTCIGASLAAQSTNTLLADRLEVRGDQLIASGNVQIWVGTDQVTASGLIYDQSTGTLDLQGPVRVISADGTSVLASSGQLNPTLESAILNDARLVLDDRLQLAAVQIRRPNGRYSEMFKVAATSCYVCAGETPIWQIRAKRIVHDKLEQQIYLENAQVRLFDIPVIYLPRFRLPDPTLKRTAGFLIPRLKTNTLLGTGIKIPYFVPIGPDKDVTMTPYLTSGTRTLELRYRQAFRNGGITVNGAVTRDDILPDDFRAYLFANGRFNLPKDYKLNFVVKSTRDAAYLNEYGFSSETRLHSFAELTRTNERSHADLRLSHYESLRSTEDNATIPSIVFEGNTQRRYFPDAIGGEASYLASIQTTRRSSDNPVDGPDADTEVDGFDVARASLLGEWNRKWVFNNGMVADVATQASVDAYTVRQHAGFDRFIANTAAKASLGLEWAMIKRTGAGTHILTPRLQYQLSADTNNAVPNQDSTRVEFDEGNLFDFTRSPGFDLQEPGNRLTFGLDWDYRTIDGASYGFTLGRIWRDQASEGFSITSGLSGDTSDWLVGASWASGTGIDLLSRAIVDDAGQIQKAEVHFDLTRAKFGANAILSYLEADPLENRTGVVSEISLNTRYNFRQDWTVSSNLRYDFEADGVAAAEVGLQFRNECIDVNFNVKRNFPSVSTARGSNDYGLTIGLLGFGTGDGAKAGQKTCRGSHG